MSYGSPTSKVNVRAAIHRPKKPGRPCFVCEKKRNPLSLYRIETQMVCFKCINFYSAILKGVL